MHILGICTKEIEMKTLNVLFTNKQHLNVSDLVNATSTSKSELCRAAMELGLMQIKEIASRDVTAAKELVAINAFKAKQ